MTAQPPQHPSRLQLDHGLGSIRQARDFVRDRCHDGGVGDDVCDTAVLLTSEIVTNAVVHARSAARLGVEVDGDGVRVEVGDDSPRYPQPMAVVDLDAASGRGMWLVDHLAGEWGVSPEPPGKTVWFRLVAG